MIFNRLIFGRFRSGASVLLPLPFVSFLFALFLFAMPFWAVPSECPGISAHAKFGRKGKHTESAADSHFEEGLSKMKRKDFDGAIDAFSQAVYFARNGYHPQSHYWLGICYMITLQDKKAILSLQKAVQQSVEPLPDAWVAMAEINIRNHDFVEARKCISSAMMNRASSERCSYLRGLMSDAEGQYAVAATHYKRALGKIPWTWTDCWMKYAECLMKMKRWADAIHQFQAILHSESILKGEPLDRIYHDIGVCRLGIGDHQGAIDNWFRSLDYNKENPEVWLQLGMLFEAEKHFSSAVKYYKEFARLMPPDSRDPRIQQVRDRITGIEHSLRPNETAPEIAQPSPYMRKQLEVQGGPAGYDGGGGYDTGGNGGGAPGGDSGANSGAEAGDSPGPPVNDSDSGF